MSICLLIQGILMGLAVAVPVGLLCISRALTFGPLCGLFSGLGVASADALAAGIAALSISIISEFARHPPLEPGDFLDRSAAGVSDSERRISGRVFRRGVAPIARTEFTGQGSR